MGAKDARVLIVEDNPTCQDVLQQQVELLGLTADCAKNGIEALELWKAHTYSIVLTDINMPLMDGCELAREIRKAEEMEGGHIPIIGVTDHAMPDDIQLYRDSGMDGHLAKPSKLENLEDVLKQWMR
jgi:CheY-like chemotaxis protein